MVNLELGDPVLEYSRSIAKFSSWHVQSMVN
jgi:hypothetical protein